MSDETMTSAQLLAEGTAIAEWILTKLIEHKIEEPGYALHMGLVLAMLAHGDAMQEHELNPSSVMQAAITPEGMTRGKELGQWFIESVTEHFEREPDGGD